MRPSVTKGVVRSLAALAVGTAALAALPAGASAQTLDAGALKVELVADPFALRFSGAATLATSPAPATGALGARAGGGWAQALRATSVTRDGDALVADVATNGAVSLQVRISKVADGIVAVDVAAPGADNIGAGFDARPGEGLLGFGERSNAVDQRGRDVESYVSDGPYQPEEYPFMSFFVPGPGLRPRDDATYFPMPWLLSTAGHGVLLDQPETSTFHLANETPEAWSVEATGSLLHLRVVGGPLPADVLRRFTAWQGRQPRLDAPWVYGTWYQPRGNENERLEQMRREDVPISVLETFLHYLPCGNHLADRNAVKARTARLHGYGVAALAYFNPMLCTSLPAFSEAAQKGLLTKRGDGTPYTYPYTSSPTTRFDVGQMDFTHPDATAFYGGLLREAIDDGFDGWMEDFGEYTPPDAVGADGASGDRAHNRYVTLYHRAAEIATRDAPRPIANYVRSGFTGTPAHARIVWGGDPTTDWGFDGLRSAVTQALSIGLSGVSRWSTDIGGFFALGSRALSPELLARWIAFGSVVGVMRNQANGVSLPEKTRPQPHEPDILPIWKRFAKLRTQLLPYWLAADAQYRRSGLPLMRHLALAYPHDVLARTREDEFLVGDDLLAAPVLEPGVSERTVYLPPGDWIDLWRSAELREGDLALEPLRTTLVRGGRDVAVPAPLEELPLFVRAGAMLPLVPADIDTLADAYDTPGVISLRERRNRVILVAFPRGRSRSEFFTDGRVSSTELKRRWVLRFSGKRRRRVELKAALGALNKPFTPCRVRVGRRVLRRKAWSYDAATAVLRARFTVGNTRVEIGRCQARRA